MDLIDRGAAIEAMKKWATQPVIMKSRYFDPKGKAIVLDMIGTVEGQPTVPAVPLDKLCEWLGERYEPPYSLIEIEKLKWPIDFRQQKEMWMVALTKWMEDGLK